MFKAIIGSAGAIGFVLVALALPSAHADDNTIGQLSCDVGQIPKFNGSNWTCAEDETGNGGAPSFVLMDSDPAGSKPVGTVVVPYVDGIPFGSPQRVVVLIEIAGVTTLLPIKPLEVPASAAVFFDQLGCTGNAYIDPHEFSTSPPAPIRFKNSESDPISLDTELA